MLKKADTLRLTVFLKLNIRFYFFNVKYHIKVKIWSSRHGTEETNPNRNHEVAGSAPGLAQWVKALALP